MKVVLCEVKRDGKFWHIIRNGSSTLCDKEGITPTEPRELPIDTKYICPTCLASLPSRGG